MLERKAISSLKKGMFTIFMRVSRRRISMSSEDPHFLAVIFRECKGREEAVDIANIYLHYCFS